jgi:hypothetical protein
MDSAYQFFRGKHRIFWHDPASAYAIGANFYPGDRDAISSGLIPIQIDTMCSENPFFHKQLWLLAKEDANRRKRNKKTKKKSKRKKKCKTLTELEKTEKVFKQLAEIKKLMGLIQL